MRDSIGLVGIAAPIGACDLHQLESVADLAGRGHVRPAAKVGPLALTVELTSSLAGIASISSTLNASPFFSKKLFGLVARDDCLGERPVARDDLAHALLDRREILGGKRLVAEEVVVEAVLDHRADRHLRARPERLHRLGEHMRAVVADELERARIVAGDEFERRRPDRSDRQDRRARRRESRPPCAWRERGRWIWRCRDPKLRAQRRALRRRER